MTDFWTTVDEFYGDDDAIDDIRVTVRRLWFYDFNGAPVRMWEGQGKLFTSDGNEWLGTLTQDGTNLHTTPTLQDGRDGTSATYEFTLTIPDLPGEPARQTYDQLKEDQWRVNGRSLWCYLAVFKTDEGLRPSTPIIAFKELTMFSTRFNEKLDSPDGKRLERTYEISVVCKDANYGRSNKPNGTYADTMQKRRAAELGVENDRGCEFLAGLASRTYTLP